jgi:CRP/FNR family transcriptional regulator, cyclic AMP receptor protein
MAENISYDSKYWFLRNHKLFSALSSVEMKAICLISNFKTAKKGDIIYFSNEDLQRVYSLKKGIIKIIGTDEAGNEIIKDILQAGDLFGQLTFDNSDYDEYAMAVSDRVMVCSFSIDDFEKVIERNPILALKYTKLVGLRFKRLENRYVNLINKDVKTRFKIFLKEWANKECAGQTQNITFKNYLTHQDVANVICSTRQTVTQLFNEFKTSNLIDYSRSEITIFDLKKLNC